MTQPDRDYDDILSRVLHSTMDPIEPAGDGLAKIQRRIAEPWLKRQLSLLRNELTALGWLILVRCEPFFSEARSGLAAFAAGSGRRLRSASLALGAAVARASSGRHQDAPSHDRLAGLIVRRWLGPAMAWLRPALAVAGAVVIVVAGVFALGQIRATFVNSNASGSGGGPGGGATTSIPGHSTARGRHGRTQVVAPGTTRNSPHGQERSTAPVDRPNASPSPCPPTQSPSPSPSATATPTPSPSATSSPSPSPTATTPTPTSSASTPSPAGLSPGVTDNVTTVVGSHPPLGHVVEGGCGPNTSVISGGPKRRATSP